MRWTVQRCGIEFGRAVIVNVEFDKFFGEYFGGAHTDVRVSQPGAHAHGSTLR
jgi:hypothetical protein